MARHMARSREARPEPPNRQAREAPTASTADTPRVRMRNTAATGQKIVRRGTRPGSIRQVRLRLWWAIEEAATLLDDPDTDLKLKAINALSTAANSYNALTRTTVLEAEVEAMQKELRELRDDFSRPASRPERSAAPTVN